MRPGAFRHWLPFIVWVAIVFVGSSIPRLSDENFGMPRGADKAAHFLEYAILAFLLYRGAGSLRRRGVPAWVLVVAAGVLIGAVDEIHQRFIPGRSPDVLDLAADAAGVVTGTLLGMRRFRSTGRGAEAA